MFEVSSFCMHTSYKGVFIATQLNATQLSWTQLTQLNSVQLSQSCFCLWHHDLQTESTVVHAVELSSVELCRYKHPLSLRRHWSTASRLFNAAPDFNLLLLQFVDGVDFCLVYTTLHDSPDRVVNCIEIWTVWRPQVWRNEVRCFSTQVFNSIDVTRRTSPAATNRPFHSARLMQIIQSPIPFCSSSCPDIP